MLNSTSIKTRFLVSVAANTGRAVISFITGLMVARGLTPAGYGDYSFLLGSFAAIRSLLDMGSSSAFYTFIAQKPQGRSFYLSYFAWLALQFVVTVLLVVMILPQTVVQKVWLGHSQGMILLAFFASFVQQQLWQTLSQIGESTRKTVRVQIMSMALGIGHLVLVSLLLMYGAMSVGRIFGLMIAEYLLVAVWSFWFLNHKDPDPVEPGAPFSLRAMCSDYKAYCKPLLITAVSGFLYDFADRWLLQRFGGAGQQGFYQIASQFSAVSLLATTSILNVFWKEIAEAHGRNDQQRMAAIYHKVTRGLVMLGAIISGFLIPWTEQIVALFLGQSYALAVPVLMIMFLFPIHQSMGQIGGTMLLASNKTYHYMVVSVFFMLISLPVSYFVQAPATNTLLPGLGLGATGMALKMVALNILSVNAIAWIIARLYAWRFDWLFQLVSIGLTTGCGFLAKVLAVVIWGERYRTSTMVLIPAGLTALLMYVVCILAVIRMAPGLAGLNAQDVEGYTDQMRQLGKRIFGGRFSS